MGLLKNLGQVILKPITAAGNAITAGLEKVTGKTYGRTTPEEAASTFVGKVLTAGILATSVGIAAGVAPVATKKIIAPVAVVTIAAPKTTEKITSSPELLEVAAATAINPVAGVIVGLEKGTSLVGTAAEGVIEKVKEVSPEVKAAVVGAGVVAAGAGVAAASGVFEKEKELSPTRVPEVAPGVFELTPEQQKSLTTSQDKPLTPETQTVSTTPKKRKRSTRKKVQPSVRQSVRVNVINRAVGFQSSKKYIKQEIMA